MYPVSYLPYTLASPSHVVIFSYAMRKTKIIIKTPLLFIHTKVTTLCYSYDDIYILYTYELAFLPHKWRLTMCSVCGLKPVYELHRLVFRLVCISVLIGKKFYSFATVLRPHTFRDIRTKFWMPSQKAVKHWCCFTHVFILFYFSYISCVTTSWSTLCILTH